MRNPVRIGAMGLGTLGALLTLAACGSKDEASGPKSREEVQQEAARLDRPSAGLYRQSATVEKVVIPGLPPEIASQMKGAMGQSEAHEFCLTAEQAERGYRDMFDEVGRKNGECVYTRFDVSGGALDARIECKAPEGATTVMTMAGPVSETGSDVRVTMDVKGGKPPMGTMQMAMRVKSERVGDCKP